MRKTLWKTNTGWVSYDDKCDYKMIANDLFKELDLSDEEIKNLTDRLTAFEIVDKWNKLNAKENKRLSDWIFHGMPLD